MMGIHHTIRVALMLSSLLVGGRLLADDGEREVAAEINKANGLLRSGDVDAAVKAYRQVQDIAPERADLSYNMAVAQYRKGDMAAAEQLFKQSSAAEDDALAAKARYNLGNCNYASALGQAETDRSAAINELSSAIANYRSALEIDPNDADSRANIELAAAMIEKLREQNKKQQQQQKQEANQPQKDGDKEEQHQENSKPSDDEQQQDLQQDEGKDQQSSEQKDQQEKSPSPQEDQSKGEQSEGQQQKPGDDTGNHSSNKNESQSKEQTPQDSKTRQQDSKSQPPESKSQSQEQKNSTGAEEKQQPQSEQQHSQSPTQKKPTDKSPREQDVAQPSEQQKDQQGSAAPKGSLTAADEKAGKTGQQDKDAVAMPDIAPDGAMTTQEAEKMLQAIRDQEMLRRLRRQAAERNQHVPVDRDW